jgi:transcription elongation GreA/GreB family factor
MSVAFTKEGDSEAAAADLPDRPVSAHTNYVTMAGLAQIDAALALARADYSAAQAAGGIGADRTAMARASRDLRYWTARRATAQLVESGPSDTIRFGSRVTFEHGDGRQVSYAIVGEDEADPANGSVSHVSPVARALIGKSVGDLVVLAGKEIEVIAVDQAGGAGSPNTA